MGYQSNVLAVPKFKGDARDRELDGLLPILEALGPAEDVRTAMKERGGGVER